MVVIEAERLLGDVDSELGRGWLSLHPSRDRAPALASLCPPESLAPDARAAVARALVDVARAMRRHFPENLFGDLDLLAAHLARGAARHGPGWAITTSAEIVDLHSVFGCSTSIRFRYVHDFLYGFDWARWVRREPVARASIGPFDAEFLAYSRKRARELVALIDRGSDAKYAPIANGNHRNPFPFRRDPASEERLMRELARSGWIPVEAWRQDAQPTWDRPYAEERVRLAAEIGL